MKRRPPFGTVTIYAIVFAGSVHHVFTKYHLSVARATLRALKAKKGGVPSWYRLVKLTEEA